MLDKDTDVIPVEEEGWKESIPAQAQSACLPRSDLEKPPCMPMLSLSFASSSFQLCNGVAMGTRASAAIPCATSQYLPRPGKEAGC